MAYTALSTIHPLVSPFLKDCPDAVVDQYVRLATEQFFRETEAWLQWLDAIPSEADEPEYALTLPAGAVATIRRIKRVEINGIVQSSCGYELVDGATLRMLPGYVPGQNDWDIDVRLSLIPKVSTVQIPDWLMDKYKDGLVHLSLGLLYAMEGEPWYRPAQSAQRLEWYRQAKLSAKREMLDQNKADDYIPNPKAWGSF